MDVQEEVKFILSPAVPLHVQMAFVYNILCHHDRQVSDTLRYNNALYAWFASRGRELHKAEEWARRLQGVSDGR